jgi:hypothetical protein
MMFDFLKSTKEKPKIILGGFDVKERGKIREDLETVDKGTILNNNELMEWGKHFLGLPTKSDFFSVPKGTIELYFEVNNFNQGGNVGFDGYIPPVFWRPKISVSMEAISSTDRKTLLSKTISKKMTWSEAQSKAFSIKSFFHLKPAFVKEDVYALLGEAVIELMGLLREKVY